MSDQIIQRVVTWNTWIIKSTSKSYGRWWRVPAFDQWHGLGQWWRIHFIHHRLTWGTLHFLQCYYQCFPGRCRPWMQSGGFLKLSSHLSNSTKYSTFGWSIHPIPPTIIPISHTKSSYKAKNIYNSHKTKSPNIQKIELGKLVQYVEEERFSFKTTI